MREGKSLKDKEGGGEIKMKLYRELKGIEKIEGRRSKREAV